MKPRVLLLLMLLPIASSFAYGFGQQIGAAVGIAIETLASGLASGLFVLLLVLAVAALRLFLWPQKSRPLILYQQPWQPPVEDVRLVNATFRVVREERRTNG